MGEPDWVKVLRVIYENEDKIYREIRGTLSDTHKLVQQSGLSIKNVERSLAFLRDHGMITQESAGQKQIGSDDPGPTGEMESTHIMYELTNKGFNVAHERELRERQYVLAEAQKDSNETLADFTIILGVTALIQATAAVVSAPQYNTPLAVIYLILLGLLLYKRKEWFYRV